MRNVLKCAAILGLMAAGPAMAAPGFEKGNWAMTLSGGGASSKGFEDSSFTLNVAPSYFLTENFEVGIRQLAAYNGGFVGETLGFVDFNIALENKALVPYVGVAFGYSYGEGVSDAWRLQPELGLKYFVNDTTYLYGNAGYSFDLNDGFDNGGWVYNLGIGFKW